MGLFGRMTARAMMDDRLVEEVYKIIGEEGLKPIGMTKHGKVREKWELRFEAPDGTLRVKIKDKEDGTGFLVLKTALLGAKKRKGTLIELWPRTFIKRKGKKLKLIERDQLVSEIKQLLQMTRVMIEQNT